MIFTVRCPRRLGRKDIDVLHQFDTVFWLGDLNYRVVSLHWPTRKPTPQRPAFLDHHHTILSLFVALVFVYGSSAWLFEVIECWNSI